MATDSIYGFGNLSDPLNILPLGTPLDVSGLAQDNLVAMPKIEMPGVGSSSGFGLNLDTAKLGLSGLATLGNLYAAFQANKLANRQFDMTKKVSQANLTNSIQSYNTTLADRLNTRAKVEGTSAEDAAAQIAAARLREVNL